MASCKAILSGIVVLIAGIAYFLLPATPPFEPTVIRGQRVVVTGASTGIGEQLAYAYSRLGAQVWISARREAVLNKVAARCRKLGAEEVRVVSGDMSLEVDRRKLINDVKQNGGKLDQLILNHVLLHGYGFWLGTPENMTTLRKDWELNFVAYVDLASQALPMLQDSDGHLGVVSSVAGKIGIARMTSYSADKFALHGFFSGLRHELHHRRTGVSVTLCVLGFIATDTALGMMEGNSNVDKSISADPAEAATAIMKAVSTGVRELRYPFVQTFLIPWLSVLPDCVEDYIARLGL